MLAILPVLDVGVIGHASGSAYVEQGSTKVICAVYGPREIPRYIFTYAFNHTLANKTRFARVRAARGWTLRSRASPSDPMDLFCTLDLALKAQLL